MVCELYFCSGLGPVCFPSGLWSGPAMHSLCSCFWEYVRAWTQLLNPSMCPPSRSSGPLGLVSLIGPRNARGSDSELGPTETKQGLCEQVRVTRTCRDLGLDRGAPPAPPFPMTPGEPGTRPRQSLLALNSSRLRVGACGSRSNPDGRS